VTLRGVGCDESIRPKHRERGGSPRVVFLHKSDLNFCLDVKVNNMVSAER